MPPLPLSDILDWRYKVRGGGFDGVAGEGCQCHKNKQCRPVEFKECLCPISLYF